MPEKRIVIIGGGYAGSELAQSLDQDFDVTLVEPKEAFVHAPAMIRSLVEPSLVAAATFPYDNLLKRGTLLRDRATAVDGQGVSLASGGYVPADFVVVATGSTNGAAFKPQEHDLDDFRNEQADLHAKIRAASSIVIVGAGAVGTELAGEIAQALSGKSVTLISSSNHLFPNKPARLGRTLQKKLTEMGVEVIFGEKVTDLQSDRQPFAGAITLTSGRQLSADLVIPAIGARIETGLLRTLPGVEVASDGRVPVDGYLRPSELDNVFAAGDVIDCGDDATIVSTGRQVPWLAKTLKAVAAGKSLSEMATYKPWKSAPILVPLGPNRGSSFLGFATVGDWVTRKVKGAELFIPKYRKLFEKK